MVTLLNHGGTLALRFGFGAASMLSVGPNDLMLMREGLARGRTITVATTVWVSDLLLLLYAMVFVNVRQWIGPSMRMWLSWLGIASLSWFAVGAWRAAFSAKALGTDQHPEARRTCLKRVLAGSGKILGCSAKNALVSSRKKPISCEVKVATCCVKQLFPNAGPSSRSVLASSVIADGTGRVFRREGSLPRPLSQQPRFFPLPKRNNMQFKG